MNLLYPGFELFQQRKTNICLDSNAIPTYGFLLAKSSIIVICSSVIELNQSFMYETKIIGD